MKEETENRNIIRFVMKFSKHRQITFIADSNNYHFKDSIAPIIKEATEAFRVIEEAYIKLNKRTNGEYK